MRTRVRRFSNLLAPSGACANHLHVSRKVNLRQSCKILRLIPRMKPDTALPWVCCLWHSGSSLSHDRLFGVLVLYGLRIPFRSWLWSDRENLENVAGKDGEAHPMHSLSFSCLPEFPCFSFRRQGPSLCLNASGFGNLLPIRNEAFQRNCFRETWH